MRSLNVELGGDDVAGVDPLANWYEPAGAATTCLGRTWTNRRTFTFIAKRLGLVRTGMFLWGFLSKQGILEESEMD